MITQLDKIPHIDYPDNETLLDLIRDQDEKIKELVTAVNALTVTRTGADCPICGVPMEIGEKEFCPNVGCPGPGGLE